MLRVEPHLTALMTCRMLEEFTYATALFFNILRVLASFSDYFDRPPCSRATRDPSDGADRHHHYDTFFYWHKHCDGGWFDSIPWG